jgi:hypothetical protein
MIKLVTIALASILTIAGVSAAQPKEDLTQIDRAETQRLMAIQEVTKPKYEYKKNEQMKPKELKQILHDVGFRGQALKEAWGTAMRESTGRPRAHNQNRNTGDNSYGLFQINMIDSLGPARRKEFNLKSNEDLFDPVRNAEIAFFMSNGGKNWSAWNGITESARKWMKEFPE